MVGRARLNRRRFLAYSAAFAAAPSFAETPSPAALHKYTRQEVEQLLRPLIITDEAALFRLAVDAYSQCVLGNLRPIEAPFNHVWLAPRGSVRRSMAVGHDLCHGPTRNPAWAARDYPRHLSEFLGLLRSVECGST
jgi:hypothetical protein